jgi:trk system potassium uptake protein TrkH
MVGGFVGGWAGSTAGGIKIVRLVIVARASTAAVRAFARPRAIEQTRMDGHVVAESTIVSVMRYFALWILITLAGVLILLALGLDATSAISGTVASLSNIGPGLGPLGPTMNFGEISGAAKLVNCLMMILGRLEVFALVALVMPGFWRR